MSIQPIARANFVDQAYRAIKQLIVGGELGPGAQLKIDGLARRLGVSASPIREALRRLENERWVETIPFRGAFVRPFEEAELMELYELREILELAALEKVMGQGGLEEQAIPPAGRQGHTENTPARRRCHSKHPRAGRQGHTEDSPAGRRCHTQRLARLGEAVDEIESALRAGDRMRYLAADTRFHQTIVEMAGNRRLTELFTTLAEQGKCFTLGRTDEAMARYEGGRDQHREILEVIASGDRRRALRLMRQHLRITVAELRAARSPANEGAGA